MRFTLVPLLALALGSAPAAGAQAPAACDLFPDAEAAAAIGGALKRTVKDVPADMAKMMSSGAVRLTGCTYEPADAKDGPPNRYLSVELGAFETPADAKTYYDKSVAQYREWMQTKKGFFPVDRISPLAGLGEEAVHIESRTRGTPIYKVAIIIYRKGSYAGLALGFRKPQPSLATSRKAAERLIEQLP